MYRKISEVMTRWQTDSVQEPLMIIGVRQTGKTWQIRQFAEKTYEDSFYVNLEEQPSFQSAFEGDLTPKGILRNLSILAGRVITEKTALIIDEITIV